MKINQAEKIFLKKLIETAGDVCCNGFYCRPGQCPIKTYQAKNNIDAACSNTGAASIAKILLNNESEPKMKPLSDEVVKAAETLIAKYEGLTLKDVQSVSPKNITGFAQVYECPLCKAVDYRADDGQKCNDCIYGGYIACTENGNRDTYFAIKDAETPIALLKAYYDRAQLIRGILKADEIAKENETKRAVDLSSCGVNYTDPASGNTLICVRSVAEFAYKAFYLGNHFSWEIKQDRSNLCLVPTRKS